jgi:8-oxo-dGTP diphosphatase
MDPIPKVLAYIIRKKDQNLELLVYENADKPGSGAKVPAGNIDRKETAKDAVIREVKEEAGLTFSEEPIQVGLFHYYHLEKNEYHLRHIFHIRCNIPAQDEWVHTVTGNGKDKNRRYRLYWIPLESASAQLVEGEGQYVTSIPS